MKLWRRFRRWLYKFDPRFHTMTAGGSERVQAGWIVRNRRTGKTGMVVGHSEEGKAIVDRDIGIEQYDMIEVLSQDELAETLDALDGKQ